MASTQFPTALITGASSGIGYELTKLFARDHYGLILVSRTQFDLEHVAEELKTKFNCPHVTVIAKDLSKPGSARELFNEIKQKHQLSIDILVNDAGVGVHGNVWETEKIEREVEMIQLNITSMVELTKLVLPEMLQRNVGRILMLGSIAAFQPTPLMASYGATKAFVANYTDAMINELQDTKVTATLLVPNITHTDFYNKAGASDTKANDPDEGDDPRDVAQRAYEALMKGDHRVYGSTKTKLMVGAGLFIPSELLTKASRPIMGKVEKDN